MNDPTPGPEPAWPRPKFQHRYRTHIVLFVLTLLTMSFREVIAYFIVLPFTGVSPLPLLSWDIFASGLWYALPMLAILSAHEFGHYYYCRRHDVDATLPYFLPAPIPLTGTLGAVIRIREPFPSRRALFDIGIAGPIAGFVALVPFLILGLKLSSVQPAPSEYIYLGEPLLLKALAYVQFGPIPEGHDIFLHPVGFAAWFGMLATALNLMPFGQLDGGHIAHAVFGRRSAYVSVVTLGTMIALTSLALSWVAMTVMMVAMAVFLGVRHPPTLDDSASLGGTRKWLAALALVIFIICFIPVPIENLIRS